jgi:hypothetical protein
MLDIAGLSGDAVVTFLEGCHVGTGGRACCSKTGQKIAEVRDLCNGIPIASFAYALCLADLTSFLLGRGTD